MRARNLAQECLSLTTQAIDAVQGLEDTDLHALLERRATVITELEKQPLDELTHAILRDTVKVERELQALLAELSSATKDLLIARVQSRKGIEGYSGSSTACDSQVA